jgi:hypothetical protein
LLYTAKVATARSDIQSLIASTVPSLSLDGLGGSDLTDDTDRIACEESTTSGNLGQREFSAAADGGTGPVIIAPDNGVGIFQLTSNNPFSNPNLLFKFQALGSSLLQP